MFSLTINPRFGETDALGHINNIAIACWFEQARNPMFDIFNPKMPIGPETWPLIMAHADYDYLDQIQYSKEVEIRSYVERVGTKSLTVYHEAWQENTIRAKSRVAMVYYNFVTRKSEPIPEEIKRELIKHIKE